MTKPNILLWVKPIVRILESKKASKFWTISNKKDHCVQQQQGHSSRTLAVLDQNHPTI
jgi:hypothetical protein